MSGVRVVKAFAAEERQLDRFRDSVTRVFDQSMLTTRQRAFYNPFIGFLPNLGLAVVLLAGGRQVVNGSLTLGDFTAFYAYLLMLIAPMRQLGIALGLAQRATASGTRVFELLDREPRLVAAPDARHCRRAPAGSSSTTCLSRTTAPFRRCATSTWSSRQVPPSRWSAPRARASRRSCSCWAALRPHLGLGADRRRRRARHRRALAAIGDRSGRRRPVPVLGQRAREHRLRAARRDARGGRAGGRARAGGGVHRGAAGRLRHARGRARADAVGRPAPAGRDRASAAGRPPHPRARRRHQLASTPRPSRRSSRRCAR